MRRIVLAEGLGTALLLYVVVGSGIAAGELTSDSGLALFAHATAVGLGLGALIAMLQTASGAHLNPSVTIAFWRVGSIDGAMTSRYAVAQVAGGVVGVLVANWSFGEPALTVSSTERSGAGLFVAEAAATFVLVLVILALVRTGRGGAVPIAAGAWVASAVFATSSTGFANPAVTLSRVFTDTDTGIAPASVPAFVTAQLIAGLLAAAAAVALYPDREVQQTAI